MPTVKLSLACGHDTERELHGEHIPDMHGVHVACKQCRQMRQVVELSVRSDADPIDE